MLCSQQLWYYQLLGLLDVHNGEYSKNWNVQFSKLAFPVKWVNLSTYGSISAPKLNILIFCDFSFFSYAKNSTNKQTYNLHTYQFVKNIFSSSGDLKLGIVWKLKTQHAFNTWTKGKIEHKMC